MKSHSIFGVRVDDLSMDELSTLFLQWLSGGFARAVFTPNPEMIMWTFRDASFMELLNQSDLSLPDGIGLKFAIAAMTDERLKYRHTGVDTLIFLAKLCEQQQKHLLFIGGENHIADLTKTKLAEQFPNLGMNAIDPGLVRDELSSTIIDQIVGLSPDVVAVALGAPKQERVIFQLKQQVPSLKIAIGVGGAFDLICEKKPRAPVWLRHVGFEWAWRLMVEPRRIKRIWRATILFPLAVISDTLKRRCFLRACKSVFISLLSYDKN